MTQISATLLNMLNSTSGSSGNGLLGVLSGGKTSSADSIFQASITARRQQINQIIVCRKWITGGKIRMILIIEFIVLSVVYISMAVIMKYNNISLKTKSYWFMMVLAVFLFTFGFVIGKYYTV